MPTTIESLRCFFFDLFEVLVTTDTLKSIIRAIRRGTYTMDWSKFEMTFLSTKRFDSVIIGLGYYQHGVTRVSCQ